MTINLSTTVLSGISTTPPGIDGDSLFGNALVWADTRNGGAVTMAFSGSTPPYDPIALNPAWTSFETPAVAIATDWEIVFVAFVDHKGFVQLASSGDGWAETRTLSQAGVRAGPALVYQHEVLYIAWQTATLQLAFATCDKSGHINYFQTNKSLTSRPTLCVVDTERIYVLCGGTVDAGPGPIRIYLSVDGGKNFVDVATPKISSFGPPSLVALDPFYLAWADGKTGKLRLAETSDLGHFTAKDFDMGCHGGGPAIIPEVKLTDPANSASWIFTLTSAWTVGSTGSTNHHVAVGSFGPLTFNRVQSEKHQQKIAKLAIPPMPNPCRDPTTVYNPATGKCVSKLGCWGRCVLQSFGTVANLPIFNPVAYAICVINCKSGG